jgi:SET domain-containing protein
VFLKVARSPLHGRGCFATQEIPAGDVVARAKLLTFPPEQMDLLFRTGLKHYLFYLKDGDPADGPFHTALAMGEISFCNHADDPNCDFALDEAAAEVTLVARRDLEQNDEITISYGDWADEII